jgi:hypothetical protein
MSDEKFVEDIHCPYCDTVNSIETKKNGIIFPFPPLDDNRNTYGSFYAEKIFSYFEKRGVLVRKKDEIDVKCRNCNNIFLLTIYLKEPINPIYDEKEQNRLKYLSQNEELQKSVPIFERFLSWWFRKEFFPFKNRLIDTYILLLLSLIPFLVIQYVQTGSYSIFKDIPFILLFLLFGILIYLFNLFNEQFHKTLNISELPLNLSEEYIKSRFGQLFENWIIKDSIYDFWDSPISNKKIHHATAYGIILATGYLIFYSLLVLGFHKNLFLGQLNFDFTMAICYLIFWVIVCFILGNILFLLLSTASTVFRIFEKIPAKINLYKKIGGFDSVINLCNLIIFQISIISLIAVVWIFGLVNIHFLEIDYGAFLREPIGIVLLCILIILMLWLYVMPILMVIKKYRQAKNDYLNELASKLESYIPSKFECDTGELQKIQFDYNRVNSLPDWPTNIKINLIISLAIPIIGWIINYLNH